MELSVIKKELFTEKVYAGKRTYFLDVKENKNKERYLIITEKQISNEGESKRNRVMIFEENIINFKKSFDKVIDYLSDQQ